MFVVFFKVDVTGQVVSDSIGTRMYSGVGGQVKFPVVSSVRGKTIVITVVQS